MPDVLLKEKHLKDNRDSTSAIQKLWQDEIGIELSEEDALEVLNTFRELFEHREKWEKEGGTDLGTRANERARYILENHKPKALEDSIKAKVKNIVESMNR